MKHRSNRSTTRRKDGEARTDVGGGKIEPPRLFVWLGGRAAIFPPLTRRSVQYIPRIAECVGSFRAVRRNPRRFAPRATGPVGHGIGRGFGRAAGRRMSNLSPGPSRVWLMSAREVRRWSRQSRSASSGRAWQCGTAATRARRPFASRRTACRCSCGRRSRTSYTNPLATKTDS